MLAGLVFRFRVDPFNLLVVLTENGDIDIDLVVKLLMRGEFVLKNDRM